MTCIVSRKFNHDLPEHYRRSTLKPNLPRTYGEDSSVRAVPYRCSCRLDFKIAQALIALSFRAALSFFAALRFLLTNVLVPATPFFEKQAPARSECPMVPARWLC